MFYVTGFFDSLKLSSLSNEIAMWKNITLYNVHRIGIDKYVLSCKCVFKNISSNCMSIINCLPNFYANIIKTWFKTKQVYQTSEVIMVRDIGNEIIWNNEAIKLNNETLFMKRWVKAGYIRICQLFDRNGTFLSLHEFKLRMPRNSRILMDYFAIRKALPLSWKSMSDLSNNLNTHIFFNGTPIDECSTKTFRNAIIKSIVSLPICQNHWSRRFPQHAFNWKPIWRASSKCTHEAKLRTLNWKIIHNIYPTKVMLFKMGKEPNNLCNTCNVVDYTEHFFFSCHTVSTVWQYASNLISTVFNISFKFNVENVLFGVYSFNDNINKLINHISAIVKQCISKFKYGKHPNLLILVESEIRIRNVILN